MNYRIPIETLRRNLEQIGVEVFSFALETCDALASLDFRAIAIDPVRVHTEEHEREVLIHEEGHFGADAFYVYDKETPEMIERAETAARRYGYRKYFPPRVLRALAAEGCTEPQQIAEALGVRESYVREMLADYAAGQADEDTERKC